MKPQYLNNVTSGGHLPLLELRCAVLEIGEIKSMGNGFFDMVIKRGSNRKTNSYFPVGTSVEQAVEMIENAAMNYKDIIIKNVNGKTFIDVENKSNQYFRFVIEDRIAKFHPLNPSTLKKQ
jgi:hypothetical protein